MFTLNLPSTTGAFPFNFVMLNWNPLGHPPTGIYDLPHFDIHFFMIPSNEVATIPGLPVTEMDPEPALAKYIPGNYVMIPGRVPAMGSHWEDTTAAEYNRALFTETFLFGSYQSKVIFYEPMITVDYFLSDPNLTKPVPQPSAVQVDGYYPQEYKIVRNPKTKEYMVILADLTFRKAN